MLPIYTFRPRCGRQLSRQDSCLSLYTHEQHLCNRINMYHFEPNETLLSWCGLGRHIKCECDATHPRSVRATSAKGTHSFFIFGCATVCLYCLREVLGSLNLGWLRLTSNSGTVCFNTASYIRRVLSWRGWVSSKQLTWHWASVITWVLQWILVYTT